MNSVFPMSPFGHLHHKYVVTFVVWCLLVAASLTWNIANEAQETLGMAAATARSNISKDMHFRKWVASHGGIYVPPSKLTPPNPYLNVPDRDVVTSKGKKLTLMNPAYALREMQDGIHDDSGTKSRIASLQPLDPHNVADDWEARALQKFMQGKDKEIVEVAHISGQPYLRLIKPVVIESDCIQCHVKQGYKQGEIRGGISTNVPLSLFQADERKRQISQGATHGIVLLLGLLGLGVAYRRERAIDNERLHALDKLAESEELWKFALEGAGDGVWDWNLKANEVKVSKRFEEILGFAKGEYDKDTNAWKNSVHPEDRDRVRAAFQAHMTGKTPNYSIEQRFLCKDGSYKWIQARGMVSTRDADGTPRRMLGTMTNISERKRSEAMINELNRDFVSFLENTSDVIFFKDENSRFRFCSQTLATLTGHASWRDVIGKHDLEILPKDTAQIYDEEELPIFRDGKPLLDKVNPYHDPAGNKRWASTNKWPLFDHDGKVTGLFGISRDITDRKRAEEALQESEIRWKFALEGSGQGVWDWDLANGTVFFSKHWKAMLGFAEGEIGNSMDEREKRIHPDDKAEALAVMQTYLGSNVPTYRNEYRMKCKDGSWKWILDRGMVVSRDDSGNPLRMIGTHTDITERKKAEWEIRYQAHYDALTDLPNRNLFSARLSQALATAKREKTRMALLFIDLDKFKPINDELGHYVGDLVLKEVAFRMKDCVREADVVSRLGGDEFVVLLPTIDTEQDAILVAEKIRLSLSQPFELVGQSLTISSCTGIAVYPEHGIDEPQLLKNADSAMYHGKKAGRNQVTLYQTDMHESNPFDPCV